MTSQITISQLFKDNCEKFPSTTLTYIKNPVLHLFPKLGKIEELIKSNIKKNSKISLSIGKNLELQPETKTRNSNYKSIHESGKLLS